MRTVIISDGSCRWGGVPAASVAWLQLCWVGCKRFILVRVRRKHGFVWQFVPQGVSMAGIRSREKSPKLTTGVDSPDIIGSRPKGALDYVLDRIVFGPGGRSVADRARRSAFLRRP